MAPPMRLLGGAWPFDIKPRLLSLRKHARSTRWCLRAKTVLLNVSPGARRSSRRWLHARRLDRWRGLGNRLFSWPFAFPPTPRVHWSPLERDVRQPTIVVG